jgi:hypothetical protein
MQTSEQLSDLAKSLAKAQAAIKNAAKDSTNPHFKSRYADLASAWDAVREPLTSNGLSIVQGLSTIENKVACTTLLLHESGQWIKDVMSMTPQQNTPQGQGSCATYLRRYMLMAIAGVAPDDDDGNEASTKGNVYGTKPTPTKTPVVQNVVAEAAPKAVTDPTSVTAFDKADKNHIAVVERYVASKGFPALTNQLCTRMHGKPFRQTVIIDEFTAINPELPDAPPAEVDP